MSEQHRQNNDSVFFVSPEGNGNAPSGTGKTFRSLKNAVRYVTRNKNNIPGDVTIYLDNGNHFLDKTLKFNAENNLPDNHSWTFKAIEGSRPVINGGRLVRNWESVVLNDKKMLRAKIGDTKYIRTFYVNGQPRDLASKFQPRNERKYFGWIPFTNLNSFEVRFGDIGKIVNPRQLEVVWHPEWKIVLYRAESVSPENVINMNKKYFQRVTSTIKAFHKTQMDINGYWWPNPARHPIYLQNDISFIDTEGEFCFDEKNKYLYYYPPKGENTESCECIYSYLDELIEIRGSGTPETTPEPINNIRFEGITFAYGAHSRISREGLQTNQAQSIYAGRTIVKNGKVRPRFGKLYGNININYADNIIFEDCVFKNCIASPVYMQDRVCNSVIRRCVFKDVGDSAIMIGDGTKSSLDEDHITKDITIENCLIRNTSLVNHGAPGVQIYFVRNLKLIHNDIYNTGYSGISVGWGWTVCLESKYSQNNVIEYNKVGHFNSMVRDGGGIYTLGQQPNSYCRYNYIYEQMEAFGGLYHDEGTSGYTTTHNVVDNNTRLFDTEQRWLNLNGFDNGPNGWKSVYNLKIDHNFTNNRRLWNKGEPTNVSVTDTIYVEDSNWPKEALEIIANSGLEKKCRYMFSLL